MFWNFLMRGQFLSPFSRCSLLRFGFFEGQETRFESVGRATTLHLPYARLQRQINYFVRLEFVSCEEGSVGEGMSATIERASDACIKLTRRQHNLHDFEHVLALLHVKVVLRVGFVDL